VTRIVSLQPTDITDHITEDGTELTRRPYPFHVDPDGFILRQDFWQGRAYQVIGFVSAPESSAVLHWREIANTPHDMIGKYVVVSDSHGRWSTYETAIATATTTETEETP
jgi:hypothetical protein